MEMLKLRSVDTAVDTEGNTYEMVRIKRGYKSPDIGKWVLPDAMPDYDLQHTVVEWYDELSNFDLMRLTMWCIEHKISTPYTFR